VWGMAVIAEGVFLLWLKMSLEAGYRPFIPIFVSRQPRWPLLLRPIFAFWWLAHCALAAAALVGLHHIAGDIEGRWWTVSLRYVGLAVSIFTLSHSSMLYLLLGVGAMWYDRRLVLFIWEKRFFLDALTVLGVLLFL